MPPGCGPRSVDRADQAGSVVVVAGSDRRTVHGELVRGEGETRAVVEEGVEVTRRRGGDLADRGRLHARVETDRDRLADVGADLEGGVAERAVEHLATVERGLARDAVDLLEALLHFLVERDAVRGGVRGVRGLHGELANALEVVRDFLKGAFSRLRQRDAVVRVSHGLVEAADLRGHAIGDREPGGVVLRAVDAQAGRQTLNGRGHFVAGLREVALSIQRHHVRVDDLWHGTVPLCQ